MKRAHPGADEVTNTSCDAFSEILEEAVQHFTVTNFTEAAGAMDISDDLIERGRKAAALRSARKPEYDYQTLQNWWNNIPESTSIQGRVTRALFLRTMSILLDEWLSNSPLGLFAGAQKWLLGINYDALTDFSAAAEGNELENTICALLLDAACAVIRLFHPSTPKFLRPAGASDSKRPRFEEKAASVTIQGNYIVKALRLDGVSISNKNRALKILLNLLRANVFENISIRPGFGGCVNEVASYCLDRCFNAPDELASDLYVLASWRNTGIESVIASHLERLLEVIEKFLVLQEIEAEEFLRSVDGALQLLASLYAFGSESSNGNLRVLTLDLEMHFNILSKLSNVAREQKSLYGIIFRHFTQLSRKLVPGQFLPLTQCVARMLQRLCIEGQDASTLYTILNHDDNFELFGSMIRTLPASLWQHVMPRRPGVLSPSMSGFNQHRLTLADRLLHRLASVLSRCADVLTGNSGRDFTSALAKRVEEDETMLASVLILLKSMRHLHRIISTCAIETLETSIIAVNWWLFNGLNADLAHDGLMLQKSSGSTRATDTLLSQSLSEMTARNLQRLTRLFAASEGGLLSELIKTSLSLLNPTKETNVDPAYLDAFACVVKLWAERVSTVKTTWQFGSNVRKSLSACQEKLRQVAAGVSSLADQSGFLIGKIEDQREPLPEADNGTLIDRCHQQSLEFDSQNGPAQAGYIDNFQRMALNESRNQNEDDQDMAETKTFEEAVGGPTFDNEEIEENEAAEEVEQQEPFEVFHGQAADQDPAENVLSWG